MYGERGQLAEVQCQTVEAEARGQGGQVWEEPEWNGGEAVLG